MATQRKRREYGEGSIYQRHDAPSCPPLIDGPPHPKSGRPTRVRPDHTCQGKWMGTLEAGWTSQGVRRRIPVTGKTRAIVVRRIKAKQRELDDYGDTGWNARITVKQWVEIYLERRTLPPKPLSPKGWKAAAQPLRRWVVPTIGHRRVADLTPGDVRKVARAQYEATSSRGGALSQSTVDSTHRQLMTCLRAAKADGARIADSVFLVEKPGMGRSDRMPLTLEETVRCLDVAQHLPHGLRWALALLYGARQGELLGLVERCPVDGHPLIDFEAGVIRLEWQLQELDYVDPRNKKAGFKIPRHLAGRCVHLSGRYHLIPPKTNAGSRELPITPAIAASLRSWLEVRPENKWGLVFPAADGTPASDEDDRQEWYAIQSTASLLGADAGLPPVHHPSGKRPYYVHECRNTAATELDEVGASDLVTTSLLGHTSIGTSRRYQKARRPQQLEALAAISARLGLAPAE